MAETVLTMHGYRVLVAANGAKGIRLFSQHCRNIEAVLCDMMMPVMDGAHAIATMQRLRDDVPIIVMSGLAQSSQLPLGPGGVAPTLLTKPFTADRLMETIQRALDSSVPRKCAA